MRGSYSAGCYSESVDGETPIFYTMNELNRLHRHFFPPAPDKLANVINKAHPEKPQATMLENLTALSKSCDIRQRHASKRSCFRVALQTEDITFNRSVCLDIMFLSINPVLYAVHSDTCFTTACFISKETADAV